MDSLTGSFVKLDQAYLENYSSTHEALIQYHQQFRRQFELQYPKPLEDKPEQFDSLTGSFVKLEMDELENYSAINEGFTQYRQQFSQYVRDSLDSIEDKVDLFVRGIIAVPLVTLFVLYMIIFGDE